MQRILLLLGIFLLVNTNFSSATANNVEKKITFNDQQPINQNGRVLVPLRGVGEAFGASFQYDDKTSKVTFNRNSDIVVLTLDQKTAYKNGEIIALDVPAKSINGRTMVPLRFLGEALGAKVEWVGAENLVKLSLGDDVYKVYVKNSTVDLTDHQKIFNELKKYSGYPGKSFDEAHTRAVDELGDKTSAVVTVAKDFNEVFLSRDYKTINQDYIDKLRYNLQGNWRDVTGYYSSPMDLGQSIIDSTLKSKLVMECQFITDESMVYYNRIGIPTVRGRQYLISRSGTNPFGLKTGFWYYQDVEVELVEKVATQGYIANWPRADYTVVSVKDIGPLTVIK